MNLVLKKMIYSGVHFGHPKRDWNPKMSPYIYKEKNGIHIIDIIQTYFYLKKSAQFLEHAASQGQTILFVGTNKQIAQIIKQAAINSNTFYVNKRWLGGLLTNWLNMRHSIMQLNQLNLLKLSSETLQVRMEKKYDRLQKYIGGLKEMRRLPDVVIIVGQQRELNAVYECQKLGLRTITILDTNCNPRLVDLFIPANDDSRQSIKWILNTLSKSIVKGHQLYKDLNN
uniref:Small ribosomal subunit protein uS2c n=1 Tax=Pedobesia claviformis TaxID=2364088 RepID=A0A386B0T1_9CHLO|nr:ribosomal protein S2 [Pedobesia claviformis]AYC65297.1 ribosomal protein S2 [Pedobesia claviformis]